MVHSDRACDRSVQKRSQRPREEIELPTSSPENEPNDMTVSIYDAITANMHAQKAKNLALVEGRKFVSTFYFFQNLLYKKRIHLILVQSR